MEVPQELMDDIKVMVQEKYDTMMVQIDREIAEMVRGYATQFIDITDISDQSKRLMHTATGRILTIKVEME